MGFAVFVFLNNAKLVRGAKKEGENLVMSVSGDNIRNIAVIGHGGEGKTTLCEAMLFCAGAIDRMGKTNDGTTVCDYD